MLLESEIRFWNKHYLTMLLLEEKINNIYFKNKVDEDELLIIIGVRKFRLFIMEQTQYIPFEWVLFPDDKIEIYGENMFYGISYVKPNNTHRIHFDSLEGVNLFSPSSLIKILGIHVSRIIYNKTI